MLPSSKAIVPQMKIMLNGLDPKGGRFDEGRNARPRKFGAHVWASRLQNGRRPSTEPTCQARKNYDRAP